MSKRGRTAADATRSSSTNSRFADALSRATSARLHRRAGLHLFLLLAMGCQPNAEHRVSKSPPAATPSPSSVAAPASPEPDAATIVETASADPVSVADQTPPDDSSPPPAPPVDRLLLIAPDGPRLCDLQLTLDQVPLSAAYQADLELVLQAARSGEHTEVRWQELCEHPDFIHGQYGNTRIENADQRRELIYRCDLNRDGRVALAELALFLTESGKDSRRLIVASSKSTAANDETMPWFRWLDRNRDGVLQHAERDQAVTLLCQLDRNDDGALDGVEFPPEIRDMTADDAGPGTMELVWLTEEMNWTNLLFQLEERLAAGSPLQAGDLGMHADWFPLLDADHNGQWDRSEVAGLLRLPQDCQIVIDWTSTAAGGHEVAVHMSHDGLAEPAADERSRSPQIRFRGATVDVVARNAAADLSEDGMKMLGWETRDTDRDGKLSSTEYGSLEPLIQLPLVAVDRDRDQFVDPSELSAALARRQVVRRCQVHVRLRRATAPVFACWDVNQDQRLSERELSQVSQRLHTLAGTSEQLTRSQVPQRITLEVVRGEPLGPLPADTADGAGAGRRVDPPGVQPAAWFRAMDTNRDGEVSRREFLGDEDQFRRGDRNQDGFWEWHEHADGATAPATPAAD